MSLELNKFENIGTLSKQQVDSNWKEIEDFSATTATDVFTSEENKAVTAEVAESALGWVPLDYSASLVLDGATFIRGEVTLTGNAQLTAPVNFGNKVRQLMVKGDSVANRELTFDTDYFKGELSDLIDITSSRWYLLTIVPYSSSHFVVSSWRAL